jgi:hypothetical protein
MITAWRGLLGRAELKDVAATEFARGEDGVGEAADCALATGEWRDEAVFGYVSEYLSGGV